MTHRLHRRAFLKRFYPLLLLSALFTGLGNMPIYKSYFISAMPGLEWSGPFYINLNVHYLFSFGLQMATAWVHLAMAMALVWVSIGCGVFKRPWKR